MVKLQVNADNKTANLELLSINSLLLRRDRNATTNVVNKRVLYLKAWKSTAVFQSLTFEDGITLPEDDRLLEGDYLPGPISSYQLKSGIVLEFFE